MQGCMWSYKRLGISCSCRSGESQTHNWRLKRPHRTISMTMNPDFNFDLCLGRLKERLLSTPLPMPAFALCREATTQAFHCMHVGWGATTNGCVYPWKTAYERQIHADLHSQPPLCAPLTTRAHKHVNKNMINIYSELSQHWVPVNTMISRHEPPRSLFCK